MNDTKSKGISWPLILVVIIIVMIMTAGTSFLMVYLFSGNQPAAIEANEKEVKKIETMGPTHSIGEFIVNIKGAYGYRTYLKTEVVLELEDGELVKEIEERYPQLRDVVNSILRSQTEEELNKDPSASNLKELLKIKINEYLTKGKIKSVFFNDFVIQ